MLKHIEAALKHADDLRAGFTIKTDTDATMYAHGKGKIEAGLAQLAAVRELVEAGKQIAPWLDLIKQDYPEMTSLIAGLSGIRAALARLDKAGK